jgi:hypothetical protein
VKVIQGEIVLSLDIIKKRIEAMRRVEITNEDEALKQIGELAKSNPDATENPVEVLIATALAMRQRWEETARA